jgi:hypothetical protein
MCQSMKCSQCGQNISPWGDSMMASTSSIGGLLCFRGGLGPRPDDLVDGEQTGQEVLHGPIDQPVDRQRVISQP